MTLSGNPGVKCPWCNASTGSVLLRKIRDHISKVHYKKLSQSLLCPYCEIAVLPSEIISHILAGCTDTPHYWQLRKRKSGWRLAISCPWCSDNVFNILNIPIFEHIDRIHGKKCSSTSLQCASCKKAVLPSQVGSHMPCVDSA